ncbi:hypothetical protein GsuE55_37140 (plasmid) [Geobacillus subterraneus]|uniref:Uncharacterized protein n=1 Tax=Geobacillus subterraneus TaxID=129338 RepID=A0A679G4A8_9BACL|nr:hypothetical protein GsuE55_37140 [Geobacillus subterraneus]
MYVFGEDVVKQAMGKAFFFDGRTNGLLETDSSGSTRPHVVDVSFA